MPIKFLANHNTIIFGQTRAGKTHFLLEVLRKKLITPFPKVIYYMYGVEQDFMKSHPEITFIAGLDFTEVKTEQPSILIIDDLALDLDREVAKTFIMGSHHRNISLFYITQNLFINSDVYRTISANCHYYVLFYNQRNFGQIHCLATQIFHGKDRARIINAYKYAGDIHRDFIILSFSPQLPRKLTVIGNFWNQYISVFL